MSSLSLYADNMLLYKPITSDISYLNATLDAGNFGFSINISLNGSTTLYMEMYLKILWEIVKSNGEYEVYTVVTYISMEGVRILQREDYHLEGYATVIVISYWQ